MKVNKKVFIISLLGYILIGTNVGRISAQSVEINDPDLDWKLKVNDEYIWYLESSLIVEIDPVIIEVLETLLNQGNGSEPIPFNITELKDVLSQSLPTDIGIKLNITSISGQYFDILGDTLNIDTINASMELRNGTTNGWESPQYLIPELIDAYSALPLLFWPIIFESLNQTFIGILPEIPTWADNVSDYLELFDFENMVIEQWASNASNNSFYNMDAFYSMFLLNNDESLSDYLPPEFPIDAHPIIIPDLSNPFSTNTILAMIMTNQNPKLFLPIDYKIADIFEWIKNIYDYNVEYLKTHSREEDLPAFESIMEMFAKSGISITKIENNALGITQDFSKFENASLYKILAAFYGINDIVEQMYYGFEYDANNVLQAQGFYLDIGCKLDGLYFGIPAIVNNSISISVSITFTRENAIPISKAEIAQGLVGSNTPVISGYFLEMTIIVNLIGISAIIRMIRKKWML